MNELFLKILNMSISASWLILAVLFCRFILKKAPKYIHIFLWGIVGIRLLCPCSMKSALSVIPSRQTIPDRILYEPGYEIQTGIPPVDDRVNKHLDEYYLENSLVITEYGKHVIDILAIIWITGAALICLHTAASYWKLHKKIGIAVKFRENILQSEMVDFPFILGIFKPKIIIPFRIDAQNLEYVIAHEQAHIQRRDNWWKPIGFLILTVYWFHPLIWLSYLLFCQDIELACDKKVIRKLENGQRADYSDALLEYSIGHQKIAAACPLAFGKNSVKKRIKNILCYKKPAYGILIMSVVIYMTTAVCFITDPAAAEQMDVMKNAGTDRIGVFDSYSYRIG